MRDTVLTERCSSTVSETSSKHMLQIATIWKRFEASNTYVSMSFIESFLNNRIDKRRAMEQHAFVWVIVVRIGNLFSLVCIAVP